MCCCWWVSVACLCPFGASSRMVGGVQPSLDRVGSSCFVSRSSKAFYAASIILGPGIVRPAFVTHVRRYAWKMHHVGYCGLLRNEVWCAPYLATTFHLGRGDIHYRDRGLYEAQGVNLACRLPVNVCVRGHRGPLLIAMVGRQDELLLGPNAGAHGGWDAVLGQYPPRAGVGGCLPFLDAFG